MISVVIPVYNGGDYLFPAVKSIIEQTFYEIEIICIDDGSTDKSLSILRYLQVMDSRIRVITRKNKGLIYTLNEAISISQYDFIARMDSDDISMSNRLESQLNLLKGSKHIGVVGCRYEYIDENGKFIATRKKMCSDYFIKAMMIFGSTICHPSVMFDRKKIGNDLIYRYGFEHAEDYELWLRLMKKGIFFRNTEEVLFKYRLLNTSISRKHSEIQCRNMVSSVKEHLSRKNNLSGEMLFNYYFKSKSKFDFFVFIIFGTLNGWKYILIRLMWFFIRK
ncbi:MULTISPECIES: glycosyltransferase family 2 protein [Bacteria]|uniref:glycosyltransferase family 2 protein n=1 Tax=Bacteria TaxID=2 RepID=UPI0018675743|nr:glycosyltransferase [Vibrio litoralis]